MGNVRIVSELRASSGHRKVIANVSGYRTGHTYHVMKKTLT